MTDDQRLIAEWYRHPGADAARRWAVAQRDGYFNNLAQTLYKQGVGGVSETELAYKRGVFRGMFRLLNEGALNARNLELDLQRQDGEQQ